MMLAEVMSIGDEFLYAQALDTHSAYLRERLMCLATEVKCESTVGDEVTGVVKDMGAT